MRKENNKRNDKQNERGLGSATPKTTIADKDRGKATRSKNSKKQGKKRSNLVTRNNVSQFRTS